MELIDKDALVAEIEKLISNDQVSCIAWSEHIATCGKILLFLDTLEVKEVNLDKELDFVKDAYYYFTSDERSGMKKVAKHFFELGLKAKGE